MKSARVHLAAAALFAVIVPGVASAAGGPPDPRLSLNMVPLGSGAEYAVVDAGSSAPDFAYESTDGGTRRLRDLRAQGHVLLVFGAGDEHLATMARERDRLIAMGVTPVAVLDMKASACRAVARRLSLEFPVVPDPQRVIGAQFNSLDPRSRHDAPAWFVIDRRGCVRGLDRFEWPTTAWADLAAGALDLATADAPLPASYPRR